MRFPTPLLTDKKLLTSIVASICLSAAPALASARQDCMLDIKPDTTIAGEAAVAGGAAGLVGIPLGAATCSAFLGAVFVDFGLSYVVCVTTMATLATSAGAVAGTSAGEDAVIAANQECAKLPDN